MDELFELLTLVQTRKLTKKIAIILYGTDFWKEVINFDALVKYGTVSAEDLKLFQFADSPDEALRILQANLTAQPESGDVEVPSISHSARPDEPLPAGEW